MDCIFCKIIKGELPSYKVYEDDKFLAFLSIHPLTLGHTLVIPKDHYRWVWDVPNIGEYYEIARKIALAQKKAFNTDMIFSFVFGEEVPHSHIWLVPRTENDGHGSSIDLKNIQEFSPEKMKETADLIKNNIL
jgi:histidine triad (HIT) family protein